MVKEDGKRRKKGFIKLAFVLICYCFCCGFTYTSNAYYLKFYDSYFQQDITIFLSKGNAQYLVEDNGLIINELNTSTMSGITEINGTTYNVSFPFAEVPYIRWSNGSSYTYRYFSDMSNLEYNLNVRSNSLKWDFDYLNIVCIGGLLVCSMILITRQ